MTNLENFLKGLDTDVDVLNIDLSNVNSFDSLLDELDSNGGFDTEIIFYASAMAFLLENDPSLKESLILADEQGFSPKNLNCEILATLLATDMKRDDFMDLESEIDEYFNSL